MSSRVRLPKAPVEVTEFAWPARFEYAYRWRLLGWFLEEHARLREAFLRSFSRAVARRLVLTERIAEVPFVLRSLRLPPGSWVMDIGARSSSLSLHLAALGYRTVGIDVAPFPITAGGPEFVRADIRRPPIKPGRFDGAVMVSTLEHIGIGWYDPRRNADDDFVVMRELLSLLRPGGLLLLTVPYGRPESDRHQRAYDRERLDQVTHGWVKEMERYWVRWGGKWQEATEAEAAQEVSVPETHAVAMLALTRPLDGNPA